MSKKRRPQRRPRREPPLEPVNDERVRSGEIPWTVEGLGAVMMHAAELHNTPHDDWDRKEHGVSIAMEDGSVTRVVFNPDMMLNQIMQGTMVRLKKEGVSRETAMSHFWRIIEARIFLADHVGALRQSGLIVDEPADPDCANVSPGLIEVLATARYEGVRLQGPEREPVPSFHVDRVIAAAKPRDSET